jgi:hypothetical protein
VYRGLADFAARAASDEYYMTVFRLPLSDRINPHAFAFTIANMMHQRSDPRMKDLNFSLRSLMLESEGPFWKALNNARFASCFGSTLIVLRSVFALFHEMMRLFMLSLIGANSDSFCRDWKTCRQSLHCRSSY